MTHAIAKSTPKGRKYLMPAVTVLAVAAIIGTVAYTRRPDLTLAPQMA